MKKNKILSIVGVFGALLIMFSGCGERSGEKEYSKAMASWKSGDMVRAQGQLEKAIRKISDNEKKAVANNQLGIVLWELDKQEQAIERFNEACRLTEGISSANLNLGIALCLAGESEQAEFQLTKILNEQPSNASAHTYMGFAHMKTKDWGKSAQAIAKGLKENPNNGAGHNALALVELHINRNSDASISRLKQIVAAYPDYAPAVYNLAVIYEKWLGNKSAALGWYKQYLAKAGTDGTQLDTAKKAIARLEQNGAGSSEVVGPVKSDPTTAAALILEGTKLHAAKKYSDAVDTFAKAIKADPSQKTAFYNMGLSYYELKKNDRATQSFINTLKLDPNFANARYMLALSYVQQRKWSDAEREAKALAKLDKAKSESLLKYIADARQ